MENSVLRHYRQVSSPLGGLKKRLKVLGRHEVQKKRCVAPGEKKKGWLPYEMGTEGKRHRGGGMQTNNLREVKRNAVGTAYIKKQRRGGTRLKQFPAEGEVHEMEEKAVGKTEI